MCYIRSDFKSTCITFTTALLVLQCNEVVIRFNEARRRTEEDRCPSEAARKNARLHLSGYILITRSTSSLASRVRDESERGAMYMDI